MPRRLDIDHRRGHDRSDRLVVETAPSGRIAAEYEATSAALRKQLEAELSRAISGEVRFDAGSRALYATDSSNYRQVPLGVVIPRSVDDVLAAVAIAHRLEAPLVFRGCGTSLAGQACNVALLIDFSKYLNRILWLDPQRRLAQVEPGCILDTLRSAAETHRLTFGPDPATHDHATLGGMIGNNSCGVHSVMAGRTSDNVRELDILTYDGLRMTVGPTSDDAFREIIAQGGRRAEIYMGLDALRQKYGALIRNNFPRIPRRVSGYENLDELLVEKGFNVARALVGTEATCVTVLAATLDLVPSRPQRVLVILGFEDIFKAADAVPEVLGFGPIGLEGMDDLLVDYIRKEGRQTDDLKLLPQGDGWLIVEFGADALSEAESAGRRLADAFGRKGNPSHFVTRVETQQKIWRLREAALGVTAHVPGERETWEGWEDSAVPREKLGDYLRDLKALFHKHGYEAAVYGHFGDGLVHCRVPFELRTEAGLRNWQSFLDQAAELVAHYGGSLSGEHGDGQARGALLQKMYGPELMEAFHAFKRIWDPRGQMNPGKLIDPFPVTSNLRVGPDYQPPEVAHQFAYLEDKGSFTRATRRCVGVGTCRRIGSENGVMCPSYMATREEKHSTRGRARLLFEMLHGGPLKNGWRSAEVEEALDLCLACKGCKKDCPVHVDMATYKAEFRAHYYAGRLRPRAAYSMGLIHRWSRLASFAPGLVNFLLTSPVSAPLLKGVAGIAQERRMPLYARESFTSWRRRNPGRKGRKGRVLLWPDTFNNYFRADTARAATRVLETLGYEVAIPPAPVCCGRPLYDWGMLDSAKKLWRRNMALLTPEIEAGTPIVGLEPACVSAFRDELPSLFHGDEQAMRLCDQTLFFSEFLAKTPQALADTRIDAAALVHLHCHHHAVLETDAESRLLQSLGVKAQMTQAGCCGMAGSFGFEAQKYEVSLAAAERALFPKLREAEEETLILANGFSCREQIEQGAGRATLHIAELVARALATAQPPA